MSWLTYPHRQTNNNYTTCPHCGKSNSRYNSHCWNCKEEL